MLRGKKGLAWRMVRGKSGWKQKKKGNKMPVAILRVRTVVPRPLNQSATRVVVVSVCFWRELSRQNLTEASILEWI